MEQTPVQHHGLCVTDIEAARATLSSVGFTAVQPNAPEPLTYEDRPEDPIGQQSCPLLGSPYRTHYVENPTTAHQIDLIEIDAAALVARPSDGPMEGDLHVVMPLADPDADAEPLRALFGDRLTRVGADSSPSAMVQYSAEGWPIAEAFYRDVLGVTIAVLADGVGEFVDVGNRLSVRVADDVRPAPEGIGKRYAGASHFRFTGLDLDAVAERVERHPGSSWAVEPRGGFAFVVGPRNETIELFDTSIS